MKSFAILPFALASFVLAAPLTWDKLIESAKMDPRYEAAQKRAEATSVGQGLKLWDKMELRYQMDGFSLAKHDFELRFVPKSFGEGSADRKHYEAAKSYEQARFAVERSLLLYDRYERGVRYVIRKRISNLNKELFQVNTDRIEVLHLKAGSATFNPEDLMSALEKNSSLKADLISDSTALRDAELKMKLWVTDFDEIDLDSSFLPTMEEIEANVSGGVHVAENYPQMAMAKGKRDVEVANAEQDVSKNRDYISHIGVGYSMRIGSRMEKYKTLEPIDVYGTGSYMAYKDKFEKETGCTSAYNCKNADGSIKTVDVLVPDYDNRKDADKFFVNLAVRLPFFDSNKDSDLRKQVAVLDAESDYLDDVRDINQKVTRLSEEISSLIAQWKLQKEFVEQVNAGSIFEQFANNAGSDPLLLLRARESALESALKAAKLEYDIFVNYLVLLDYAGGLARIDAVNHLREGLK